ncbi:hypothetical protein D3C75_568960 [compost metagenome]
MPALTNGCSSLAIKKGCFVSQFILRLRDTLLKFVFFITVLNFTVFNITVLLKQFR